MSDKRLTGKDGAIYLGGTARVANKTEWTLGMNRDIVDATVFGSISKTYLVPFLNPPKIIIVGARAIEYPSDEIISTVLAIIAASESDSEIAVRAQRNGEIPSSIERLSSNLATETGRQLATYRPPIVVGGPENARSATFARDYTMVDQATKVFAFFHPDDIMGGGTGHVVKAALDREVPVEAYSLDGTGHLYLVGSDDGPASLEDLAQMYDQAAGLDRA